MKKICAVTACFIVLIACSKKITPTTTPTTTTVNPAPGVEINSDSNTIHTDTTAAVTANSAATVLVVSDGNGKIITEEKNLPPEENIKFNNLQLSKGFTPQQKYNLNTRYKTIPPRVLYVAKEYQLNSLRGSYYIYKKKFWYWKKKDGLFYLDEKYYL